MHEAHYCTSINPIAYRCMERLYYHVENAVTRLFASMQAVVTRQEPLSRQVEPATTLERCLESQIRQFRIVLDSEGGVPVGIDFDFLDGKTLTISTVRDGGAILEWNKSSPHHLRARKGDRIDRINDSSGDSVNLIGRLEEWNDRAMQSLDRKELGLQADMDPVNNHKGDHVGECLDDTVASSKPEDTDCGTTGIQSSSCSGSNCRFEGVGFLRQNSNTGSERDFVPLGSAANAFKELRKLRDSHILLPSEAHADTVDPGPKLELWLTRPRTIRMSVYKGGGYSLGMEVDYVSNGTSLRVSHIGPGAISDWNECNPTMYVNINDRIVSVNRNTGLATSLMSEMRKAERVALVFLCYGA